MSDAQMTGTPLLSWVLVTDAQGASRLESRWTTPAPTLAATAQAA